MKDFRAAGLRYGVHQCTPRAQASGWYGALTEREQVALAFSQGVEPKALARNISQSVTRVPTSTRLPGPGGSGEVQIAPTFLPGQVLWLELQTQETRLLLGREALAMQGFPINENPALTESFEESLMQNLAGNAMNVFVVLALLQAILTAVPWALAPQSPLQLPAGRQLLSEAEGAAVDAAMELFFFPVTSSQLV